MFLKNLQTPYHDLYLWWGATTLDTKLTGNQRPLTSQRFGPRDVALTEGSRGGSRGSQASLTIATYTLPSVKWLTAKCGAISTAMVATMTASFQSLALCRMLARLMRGTSWERRGGEKGRKLASGLSLAAVVTVSKVVSAPW